LKRFLKVGLKRGLEEQLIKTLKSRQGEEEKLLQKPLGLLQE
jgi:hypothetical protein